MAMRGWGAVVIGLALVLEGCTSMLDMVPVAVGDPPVTVGDPPAASAAPRVVPIARSSSKRAFPYPLDIENIPTSANHDATRDGASVDYVVIHYTEITYERTLAAFNNPHARVSAHFVVRGDGRIAELVSPDDIAWHAGNNWFNDHSVGIELELSADSNPAFTEAQYQAGALLTCAMSARYGVPIDRAHIIGHNEVPGSTHTDPGPTWNWAHFMWYVRLCAPANAGTVHAQFVSQSPYAAISTGDVASVSVVLKNTGETTWRKGTSGEAHLAIPGNSTAYAFLGKDWLAPDRPASQQEAVVAPGQTATFTFQVKGGLPGRYVVPLRGVIDGGAWMDDLGMFAVVTVD